MAERAREIPKSFDWKSVTAPDSPRGMPDVLEDPLHRDLSTAKLEEGDPAHDFELPVYDFSDGTERATGRSFHLLDAAADRPVALIFGSYT